MARTAVLGFPRIGADRELQTALEEHWAGRRSETELQATARSLRREHLLAGQRTGIDVLPVGDFALYDHVLDTAELVGIRAERHAGDDLAAHFRACRGGASVQPLEPATWFDTNYRHLVPELQAGQSFELRADKWLAHLEEAHALGVDARPVVLGPFSLLLLAKGAPAPLAPLAALTEVYGELLRRLSDAGAHEVQFDEPCLALDRTESELDAFAAAYGVLLGAGGPAVCLATYFAALPGPALARVAALAPAELHVDLVRAPKQLDRVLASLPAATRLSAGVVDGRNVWATDADRALDLLDRAAGAIGSERITIAPSCSLLHVPYRAARERRLDPELRGWLAFGEEKLGELALLVRALDADAGERDELLAGARQRAASRRSSPRTNDTAVRRRVAALIPEDDARERHRPPEPECDDMVEYAGEELSGIAISEFGWVQSHGSRCVKPPILFGDVARRAPLAVGSREQTRSVTLLRSSFVRDDQPRRETRAQLALAIGDEVTDLEPAPHDRRGAEVPA